MPRFRNSDLRGTNIANRTDRLRNCAHVEGFHQQKWNLKVTSFPSRFPMHLAPIIQGLKCSFTILSQLLLVDLWLIGASCPFPSGPCRLYLCWFIGHCMFISMLSLCRASICWTELWCKFSPSYYWWLKCMMPMRRFWLKLMTPYLR